MRDMLIAAAVLGAACTRRTDDVAHPRPGTLAVEWSGKLRGSFTAPATARWCPADTLLEIIAARADTAIGISLLARDSVSAGVYLVNGIQTFTPGRPQASAALRMLGDATLLGYEGMSGQITVGEGGSRAVSGTIEVRFRPVSGMDTLQVKGSFDRIPVTQAGGICGRANKPGGG
ncbi:MAG TPA: hypothetical protein VFU23_11125 [Gemmatimonadales bacterium]|nr:hypothetical protein [Gemmatimonadales bacterium]